MGNNKVAVLSVSAIVLVAVVATVAVTVSNRYSQPEKTEFSTSNKNIKDFCRPTDYQATCESSLSEVADNTTDPKELVNLAFQVTIDHIKKAFDHSTVLSEAAKDSRTSDALENCRELLDYAIDDLKSSIDRLDGFSLTKLDKFLDDLKVWISATITYQETCLDGFENTTTDAAESMRKALNSSAELTSNILAIVINFDSALDSLNLGFNRKLLSEEYPSWISPGKRRLLQQSPAELKPNVTVAKDGSGDVKTIGEAVLRVNRSLANVMMIGDGTSKTKITGKLNYIDGTATFKTATVAIVGDGFIGKDLWIENSAGAAKHQAVALRVQSDKSVFYNVRMDGYQDTLYVHTKRQFYRECTISGTQNIVTAQGRKDRRQASAIILHNCTISADPAYFRPEEAAHLPWPAMEGVLEDLRAAVAAGRPDRPQGMASLVRRLRPQLLLLHRARQPRPRRRHEPEGEMEGGEGHRLRPRAEVHRGAFHPGQRVAAEDRRAVHSRPPADD
ncbi:pectinesterase [Musa troglodytarum]|uniref:Pectinesterase n=1 Tax=Musa troglodytarum TaxID=320322 RepID=A0A9E7EUN4_9LILI|nr:pectinesterase [Musa troglodytarum]